MVQHQHQITDEDVEQYRDLAEHRSKIYWLLSEFFLEPPTAERLQVLHATLCTRASESAVDGEPLLDELQAILRAVPDLALFSQELGIEYTRLFHGLKADTGLAPPYESVHRESRLIGEMTKAVIDDYADAGYKDIHEPAGPQDHLGVELRFLSLLCYDEAQSWSSHNAAMAKAGLARQSRFLDQHVLAWIPGYCEKLEHESSARYYQIVARLTRQALEHDQRTVHEVSDQFGQN